MVDEVSKRILVTGSRHWTDRQQVFDHLHLFSGGRGTVLVHGACPTGADRIADEITYDWPWIVERHPAYWDAHGKAAGPLRNQQMVDLGADVCIAFLMPDSRGTVDCAAKAEAAGIRVVRVYP